MGVLFNSLSGFGWSVSIPFSLNPPAPAQSETRGCRQYQPHQSMGYSFTLCEWGRNNDQSQVGGDRRSTCTIHKQVLIMDRWGFDWAKTASSVADWLPLWSSAIKSRASIMNVGMNGHQLWHSISHITLLCPSGYSSQSFRIARLYLSWAGETHLFIYAPRYLIGTRIIGCLSFKVTILYY